MEACSPARPVLGGHLVLAARGRGHLESHDAARPVRRRVVDEGDWTFDMRPRGMVDVVELTAGPAHKERRSARVEPEAALVVLFGLVDEDLAASGHLALAGWLVPLAFLRSMGQAGVPPVHTSPMSHSPVAARQDVP